MKKLAFAGSVEGSPFNISYSDTGEGAALLATCPDGGAVLRFMDIYTRMKGGELRLVGRRNGPRGPLVGTFELADFEIVNEPAMARVVETKTTGPNPVPTGFNSNRVHFLRAVANFSKNGQTIAISDALLRGAGSRRHVRRAARHQHVADCDHRHLSAGLSAQQLLRQDSDPRPGFRRRRLAAA